MIIDAQGIERHLERILDTRVAEIGRAGNMLWFCMGPEVKIAHSNGVTRTVNSYALHLQCAWRMVSPSEMLISGRDFYRTPTGGTFEKGDSWDRQGHNLFDAKAKKYNDLLINEHIVVEDISASPYGDLTLKLSNKHQLQVFIDDSAFEEYWRFIDFTDDESHHVVVFDAG